MPQTAGYISIGADFSSVPRQFQEALNRAQRAAKPLSIRINNAPLGRITGDIKELTKSLDASSARVIAFGATTGIIYGVGRAFSELVKSTVLVEKKLQSIQVILGATTGNLSKLSNGLFDIANKTATSFSEVADAATEFARQGLPLNETLKRTRDAMVLVNTSGIEAKEAVSALTAAVNTFSKEALDTTTIINKLANVDAAFAVSQKDLAEGISRVGSVAADAHVSFDELVASITSVQQTTSRGGAAIANGLKSIFTRLQRPQVIETLRDLKVGLEDSNGASLNSIQILKNLAGVYKTLSDSQKSTISQQIAGVHQINTFKALIGDLSRQYSILGQAQDVSANSTNEALLRNTELVKTLAAQAQIAGNNITKALSKVGNVTILPNAKGLLSFFNNSADLIGGGEKGDKAGASIGEGILRGIGSAIKGPGAIALAAIFIGLSKRVGKFAFDSIKELAGLNDTTSRQQALQANINGLLATGNSYYLERLSKATSVQEEEEIMLKLIQAQNTAIIEQNSLFASQASRIGKRVSPVEGGGFKNKAQGYIPNASGGIYPALMGESNAIKRGVGGASQNAKTSVIPNFNFGGGKVGPVVANTSEFIIKGYKGGSGSAIFNPEMVKSVGGIGGLSKLGNVSRVAEGFVPNLAGGLLKNASFGSIKPSNQFRKKINQLESFLVDTAGIPKSQLPKIRIQNQKFGKEDKDYSAFFDPTENEIRVSLQGIKKYFPKNNRRNVKRDYYQTVRSDPLEDKLVEILFHEGFHSAYGFDKKASRSVLPKGQRINSNERALSYLSNFYDKKQLKASDGKYSIEEALAVKFGRLNSGKALARGYTPKGGQLVIDPKLKYLYNDNADYDAGGTSFVGNNRREEFRKLGYEIVTPEDLNILSQHKGVQKFIKKGGKLNLIDPEGNLKASSLAALAKKGDHTTLNLSKAGFSTLKELFNVTGSTHIGVNKLEEANLVKGHIQNSVSLGSFLKNRGLGELTPRNSSRVAEVIKSVFPGGAFIKKFGSVQSQGVFRPSDLPNLSAEDLPKGDQALIQAQIPNASPREYRVNVAGVAGKARLLGDSLPRAYNGQLDTTGFKNDARSPGLIDVFRNFKKGGVDLAKETLETYLGRHIARQQVKNAFNALPEKFRSGSVAGTDVIETGTKGVVKRGLQLLGEKVGIPIFKGGGQVEFNLPADYRSSEPIAFSGSRVDVITQAAKALEDNSRILSNRYAKEGKKVLSLKGDKRQSAFNSLQEKLFALKDIDRGAYISTVKKLGKVGFGTVGLANGFVPSFASKLLGSGSFGSFYDNGQTIDGIPIGDKIFDKIAFSHKSQRQEHIRNEFSAAKALEFGSQLGSFGKGIRGVRTFGTLEEAIKNRSITKEIARGGSLDEIAKRLINAGLFTHGVIANDIGKGTALHINEKISASGVHATDLHHGNFNFDPQSAQSLLELISQHPGKATKISKSYSGTQDLIEGLFEKGGTASIFDSGKLRTQYRNNPDLDLLKKTLLEHHFAKGSAGGYVPNFANGLASALKTEKLLTGENPKIGFDSRLPGKIGVYSPSQGSLSGAISEHLRKEPGRNLGNIGATGAAAQNHIPHFAPINAGSSQAEIDARNQQIRDTKAANEAKRQAAAADKEYARIIAKAAAGEDKKLKNPNIISPGQELHVRQQAEAKAAKALKIKESERPFVHQDFRNEIEAAGAKAVKDLKGLSKSAGLKNELGSFFQSEKDKGGFALTGRGERNRIDKSIESIIGGRNIDKKTQAFIDSSKENLVKTRLNNRAHAGFGASFALPIIAQTVQGALGRDPDSRSGRTTSGIVEGVSSAGIILSLFQNKVGLAASGVVAAFSILTSITGNVAKPLEGFLKNIDEANNALGEQSNAISQTIASFDAFQQALSEGGSGQAIKRSGNALVGSLNQVTGPNKQKLLEAIQSGNIENLRDVVAENNTTLQGKVKTSQFVGKFAEETDKAGATGNILTDKLLGSRRDLLEAAKNPTSGSSFVTRALFRLTQGQDLNTENVTKSFGDLKPGRQKLLNEFAGAIPIKTDKLDATELLKKQGKGASSASLIQEIFKTSGIDDPDLLNTLLAGSVKDTGEIFKTLVDKIKEAKKDKEFEKLSTDLGSKVRGFVKLSEDVIKNVGFRFELGQIGRTGIRERTFTRAQGFLSERDQSLNPEAKQGVNFALNQAQTAANTRESISSIINDKIGQFKIPEASLREPQIANSIAKSISEIVKNPTSVTSELEKIGEVLSQGGSAPKELIDSFKEGSGEIGRNIALELAKNDNAKKKDSLDNQLALSLINRQRQSSFLGGGDLKSQQNADFGELFNSFSGFKNRGLLGTIIGSGNPRAEGNRDRSILGDQSNALIELDKLGLLPKSGEKRDNARGIIQKSIQSDLTNNLDEIIKNAKGTGLESLLNESRSLIPGAAKTQAENALAGEGGANEQIKALNSLRDQDLASSEAIRKETEATTANILALDGVSAQLKALDEAVKPLDISIQDLTKATIGRFGLAPGQPTPNQAKGFIPNFSAYSKELNAIKAGVGGARAGDRPLFANVKGLGKSVINSGESLIGNFLGSGKDAIFNREMSKEVGVPLSSLGNLANGYVPNFAFSSSSSSASSTAKIIAKNSKLSNLLKGGGKLARFEIIRNLFRGVTEGALDTSANLDRPENFGVSPTGNALSFLGAGGGGVVDAFRLSDPSRYFRKGGVGYLEDALKYTSRLQLGGFGGVQPVEGPEKYNSYKGGSFGSYLAGQITESFGGSAPQLAPSSEVETPPLSAPIPKSKKLNPNQDAVTKYITGIQTDLDKYFSSDKKDGKLYKSISDRVNVARNQSARNKKSILPDLDSVYAYQNLDNFVKNYGDTAGISYSGSVRESSNLAAQAASEKAFAVKRGFTSVEQRNNFIKTGNLVTSSTSESFDVPENPDRILGKKPKEETLDELVQRVTRGSAVGLDRNGQNIYAKGFIPNFASILSRRARQAIRNIGGSADYKSSKTVGPLSLIKQMIDLGNIKEAKEAILNGGLPESFLNVGLNQNNLAGVSQAIEREQEALIGRGIPRNLAAGYIFAGSRPEIGGIGIGNYLDEPHGLSNPNLGILQGINRVKSQGGNPSTSGVANFAAGTTDLAELIATLKDLISKLDKNNEDNKDNNSKDNGVQVDHSLSINANINGKIETTNSEVESIIKDTIEQLKARIQALEGSQRDNKSFVPTPPRILPGI